MFQEKIIDILKNKYKQEVLGMCIYGSRARNVYSENSDMDVLVLVKENSLKVQSVFLKDEGIFIECFIFDINDFLRIKNQIEIDSSYWDGIVVHWLQEPIKILKDTDKILENIIIQVKSKSLVVKEEYKIKLIQNVSRELECLKRYHKNDKEEYQQAFILKFNYLVTQLLVLYLALRNEPWWGEKNALIYLKNQNSSIYENYLKMLKTTNNQEKMINLEQFLVELCTDGYSLLGYATEPVVSFKG